MLPTYTGSQESTAVMALPLHADGLHDFTGCQVTTDCNKAISLKQKKRMAVYFCKNLARKKKH